MSGDTSDTFHRGGWKASLQDVGDRVVDKYLGIDTTGIVFHEDLEFTSAAGGFYQASNWVNLISLGRTFRKLRVTPRDSFIDFGCGKGQILAMAARYPFTRVIGLDLSAKLLEVAQQNIDRIQAKARCGHLELVNENALDYEIPDDITYAYFYMPFPTEVYEPVVSRLAESARRSPRLIHIIYLLEADSDMAVPGRYGFHKVVQRRRMAVYSNGFDPRAKPSTQVKGA